MINLLKGLNSQPWLLVPRADAMHMDSSIIQSRSPTKASSSELDPTVKTLFEVMIDILLCFEKELILITQPCFYIW